LLVTILKEKAADSLHSMHIADNFLTFSAFGIKVRISSKPLLWKVPSRAEMMTILALLATFSEKATT
jgi:hypothetical protein